MRLSVTTSRASERGLSVVEFLIGLAVGLFVVGGAAKLFVDYIGSNRTLLLETRVNQDLRAAADLVMRDLRRAGYWRNAPSALYVATSAPAASNPYVGIGYDAGTNTLTYAYAKDANDTVDTTTEAYGFRTSGGVLQMRVGGAWQPITDPKTMLVNNGDLIIAPQPERQVDLYTTCPCIGKTTCKATSFQNPDPTTGAKGVNYDNRPVAVVRQYVVQITGRATEAPNRIVRTLNEVVRPRNDQTRGSCPL